MTERQGRRLAWGLLALWAGTYIWSFAAFFLTTPTGDGFTRGLNRITAFYGWQIAACALSLLVLWTKRHIAGTTARHLFWAPVALAGLLFVATVGVIAIANYGRPTPMTATSPPPASPRPVTAPAAVPNR